MMPVKDLHRDPFKDATITKLEIFEKYIEAWLPVFIYSKYDNSANICDFFAGTGQDINGVPGSPLRIIEVIEKYTTDIISKNFKVRVILNELDKIKFEELSNHIVIKKQQMGDLSKFVSIELYNEDFKNLFDLTKDELQKTANLFFLDQNGIKYIGKKIIQDLEQFDRTDFMFFISSGYFIRFGEQPSFKDYFPEFDIDYKNLKTTGIHREILRNYRKMLPNESKTKLHPFSIKKGKNIHGLIFGSKHPFGVEKFLNIAWSENQINGEANFDIDDETDPQLRLFDKKIKKLDKFKSDLFNYARQKKEFTNQEILEYTLDNGFPPKAANQFIREMRNEGILERFSHPKIGCKQVFSDKDIVTFRLKK